MDNLKVCPACTFSNAITNTICERCGTPLLALLPAKTTLPVPEGVIQAIPGSQQTQARKSGDTKDSIAFYLVGQEKPIVVKNDVRKIVFGRSSPGEAMPTVDLTPYDAHLFGVSRQHAIIHRSDNGCFLQDMGSTNGTWLNEKRLLAQKLYTLESGDLVRLGQLGFRAYFETTSTLFTLGLVDEVKPGQHMTPVYLDQRLTPYLVALASAQQILDATLDRPLSLVSVRKIEVDEDGRILVSLTGARDILRLVESQLSEWRTKRMILIERLRELNDRVKADANAAQDVKPTSDPLLRDVRSQLAEFARSQVRTAAPQLSESAQDNFAEKLIAPLQALLFSPLQPTLVESKRPAVSSTPA